PKRMAIELFKPFIYNKLEEKGLVTTIKSAKKMVEKEAPEVWDALDEVVMEHPIFLNRAPTLHRLGIQAFEPILVEGKAIQLHPLVCVAYNADFDGDQMAVHVPLSVEAQTEARVLMMSTNNVLSPAHGEPIIMATQDIVLGIYYMTRDRLNAKGEGKIFHSREEVLLAWEGGVVHLQAGIKVRIRGDLTETTVGRVILSDILPDEVPFSIINKTMRKKDLAGLINESYRIAGAKKTVILADHLKDMGYRFATLAGISVGINHMMIPVRKEEILEKAQKEVSEVQHQYSEGLITDGEQYNKVIDIWTRATDEVAKEMMDGISVEYHRGADGKAISTPSFNPIFIMADSGARGSKDQIRQLAGMRGLMAKPSGEIIETPIQANFREGLSVLEYFVSTHGARKGLADTALKTANSGYLTRRLVDVAQDATITEEDCGTIDGIEIGHLLEGGEIIQRLGERILGRVALTDIVDPVTGEVLVKSGEQIDEEGVRKIEEAGIPNVEIRSVLTCRSPYGVCAKCYGRDLARGGIVAIGEAIGIIAAESIGEPGTQLTMRTFHIGGTASGKVEQAEIRSRGSGAVRFERLNTVRNLANRLVVLNRNGEIVIVAPDGRERERFPVIYGAELVVEEDQEIDAGEKLAQWDPFTVPILTEVPGVVKFGDLIEGITMKEKVDPVTGKASRVVIQYRAADYQPRISIKDERGRTSKLTKGKGEARYQLPVGAIITANEGDKVAAGEPLSRIPRETTKTKDITGGLPRIAELFEVRKPKEYAVITEIDGEVSFGKDIKSKRRVVITPEYGDAKEYLVPKGKYIKVHEGDYIRAGESLMDGVIDPHDYLRVKGIKDLARYMVGEIQEVYRLQGVKINDKHIEVIVRQMLRKVKITGVGDSIFMFGEQVERRRFEEENERIMAEEGGEPASAEPLLLGITRASLSTDSFISAASFQETTKVLTEASIAGKEDYLRGLKENVIMGRLIPAGTGKVFYEEKERRRVAAD
ncbi:MAG: DNA-directed RNA polymerase subunit beta', partial [Thermodesulfobacteriota bacterium]|nr:DNA-directed RNA polymerase subunit beta' [Thermodesulfobacteriota bacterium]